MKEQSNIEIKEIVDIEKMIEVYPLILQLNETLTVESYTQMLKDMLPKGYRQAGAYLNGICVGVAGFWINTKIYCGKYVEPDNVVVDEKYRSLHIGAQLIQWLHGLAIKENCTVSLLDAYVQNKEAHKFYFREGYTILGFHMVKKLQ